MGSLLGGIVGGLVMYIAAPIHLAFVGSLAGLPNIPASLLVWLGLAVALGLLFGSIAGPAINVYTALSTWLTTRFSSLQTFVDPFSKWSPLGATTAGVGLLYGIAMGVVVGLVIIPAAFGVEIPTDNYAIVAGYAVFGVFGGLGYGLTLDGTIPVPSVAVITPATQGAILGPLIGGGVAGALIYAQQPVYLTYLSTILGYGSATVGFAIWMILAYIFGFIFAVLAYGQATRGNGTTGYGFVYGVVLAVFVGLIGLPAIVTATSQWNLGFADVTGLTLIAFVLYGLIHGSIFGKTVNNRPLRPLFLVGRSRATVLAALLAGLISSVIIYQTWPVYFLFLAPIAGGGSYAGGLAVWLTIAVLLGMGFATFPARRIERRDLTGQTGIKLGTLYGLLIALPIGMFIVPEIVNAQSDLLLANPFLNGGVLTAFVLFGLFHGVTYGGIKGSGHILPRFLHGRIESLLGGVLAGGALGAIIIYATTPANIYFLVLGSIIGIPTLTGGIAVWLVLTLILGILFIPLAANIIEYRVGPVRGAGVGIVWGSLLTAIIGMAAVPAMTQLSVPHLNPPIAGYFVYGLIFSTVYGAIRSRTLAEEDAPTSTTIGTAGQRAIVFGSLFGGAAGGLIVHHTIGAQPVAMLYMGALVGYPGNIAIGWVVWLALTLILGVLFAGIIGPRLDEYTRSIREYAERDQDIDAIVGDLFDRAPTTATAGLAGFIYGLILAVTVGAIAIPLAVNTTTAYSLAMPIFQPYFLLAFIIYGTITGIGYGVMKEF